MRSHRISRRPGTAIALVVTLCASSCGADPRTSERRPADAEIRPVTVVGAYRRFTPPDEPGLARATVMAGVPEVLDAATWAAWGPTHEDEPQPPEVPADRQPILAWSPGTGSAEIEGYRLSADGLVLVATVRRAEPGCVGADFEDGYTTVVTTDDPEVTPGMAIAPPEITEVEVPC